MKVICAWCGSPKPDVEPLDDERISHGICKRCKKVWMAEWQAKKEKDADGTVHGTEDVAKVR